MKALVWHGKEDIRYDTVSDPEIEDARDAIIKVTSCAICGSDLHLYHNFIPAMLPGDVMGHETMGEVVELGPEAKARGNLNVGDRVVIPFTIICGECDQCKRGNFSVCQRTNRKKDLAEKVFGHSTAGLFGYTHLTGGYAGGQAEYLRVPFADATHIKVPDGIPDEKLLFLSDILPTGWHAAMQADIQPGDTVAIWGCGPVGQMTIRSAILLGAEQVIAIDFLPERLSMAEAAGAITINFEEESVTERLTELTGGEGPHKCIDAVGFENHVCLGQPDTILDRFKQFTLTENDRGHVLREMIYNCRPAGVHLDHRRLQRHGRQVPDRHRDEQGPDVPNGPGARQPLDRRPPPPDRGRADRSLLRHNPQAAAVGRAGDVPDVPRQAGQLHQGDAAARSLTQPPVQAYKRCNHVVHAFQAFRRHSLPRRSQGHRNRAKLTQTRRPLRPRARLVQHRPRPDRVARCPARDRALGAEGNENVVRAMGARELAHGVLCLSVNNDYGAWTRVAGDAVDLAALAALYRDDNPKKSQRRTGDGGGRRLRDCGPRSRAEHPQACTTAKANRSAITLTAAASPRASAIRAARPRGGPRRTFGRRPRLPQLRRRPAKRPQRRPISHWKYPPEFLPVAPLATRAVRSSRINSGNDKERWPNRQTFLIAVMDVD